MPFQDVDAYLAALPEDQRAALQRLRDLIKAADPNAVESISYGVPTFKHNKRPLIYIGAAKAHCAVYGPAVNLVAFADELQRFSRSKGTIRFQPDDPLPDDLVRRMVRARLEALAQASAKRPATALSLRAIAAQHEGAQVGRQLSGEAKQPHALDGGPINRVIANNRR